MNYPHITRQSIVDSLHGRHIPDPYRRLEDPAEPETIRWQGAQDRLWREHAIRMPGRDQLHARVAELSHTGTITAPAWHNDRRFFLRQLPGQEHPVLLTAGPDGREWTLVDPMAFDPAGTVTLDHWQPDAAEIGRAHV